MNHATLSTRNSEDGRLVASRKRQSDSARCTLRGIDLEAEDIPVCRPLGREPTQRGRKAGIDVRQVANLGCNCPCSTSLTQKLDTADIGLDDPSAQRHIHVEDAPVLTVKELVGPVAHPCACEIRGSFAYGA